MFLMASGVGLHLSGITSFFQDNVSSFPKKMRAVKPESIRNKTDKPTSHKTVYTFFETLNDSTMTQYVDLEGKLMPTVLAPKKVIPGSTNNLKILPLVKKNESLKTFAKLENDQEPKSSVPTTPEIKALYGYVVQVGSFRDEGRAGALRTLLKNNGFDAFLTPTELTNNGGTWHRVFLGRYIDEEKAQEAARLARSQYKLNAVVARNTG